MVKVALLPPQPVRQYQGIQLLPSQRPNLGITEGRIRYL